MKDGYYTLRVHLTNYHKHPPLKDQDLKPHRRTLYSNNGNSRHSPLVPRRYKIQDLLKRQEEEASSFRCVGTSVPLDSLPFPSFFLITLFVSFFASRSSVDHRLVESACVRTYDKRSVS
jgi:hypothetical protein